MSESRKKSNENLNLQSQQLKEEATAKFETKLDALNKALKVRLKNPTDGLPRSLSDFFRWRGQDGELDDIWNSRSSLNSSNRNALKGRIENVIKSVKNPAITGGAELGEYKELAEQQEKQLSGLSAANQHLEQQIESLRRDLLAITADRNRYKKNLTAERKANQKKSSDNMVRIK